MTKPLGKEIITQLLAHPKALTIAKEVTILLEKESKRRRQFYKNLTDTEKAEFINGEILVHGPVTKEHNDATILLSTLISSFVAKYKLGYIGILKLMVVLERNDYEPDICFFDKNKSKAFTEGQFLFPVPDFVVEVLSADTEKNDRTIKFQDYEANEVMEYLLIDPVKKVIELYRLNRTKKYELIIKSGEGTLKSKAIKGFSIAIEAIFDKTKNLAELTKILSDK